MIIRLSLCAAFALFTPAFLSGAPKKNAEAPKLSASQRIDQLVAAGYAKHGVEPNPMTSDEVFVRRIHLDIVGRVPTKEETLAFLNNNAKNKRTALVDELLDSEGYVSHFFNYWSDLLRAKTQLAGAGNSQAAGAAYQNWIRESLQQNKPYDVMVKELLTASGSTWDNGAVGYYIRDYGMSLDNLAMTSQLFLGTQIVCAQCHDHPFDEWTQMDYYQMAAFTYGMQTTNQYPNARDAIALYRKQGGDSVEERQDLSRAFSEILKPVRFNNVFEVDRGLRLPHDYQYSDAKPKAVVEASVPFGEAAKVKKGEMPIHSFASWITSPENDRFTTVIANRLWKKAMGLGLIEPVDDFKASTEASNPELMRFLEKRMIAMDYDMKSYLRMIFLSDTYQREASTEEVELGAPYHFPGPVLRRMTAEQIWDSVVAMIVDNPDQPDERSALQRKRLITRVKWTAKGVYDLSPEEMLEVGLKIAEVQRGLAAELEETQKKVAEARESGDLELLRAAQKEGSQARRKLDEAIAATVYRRGLNQQAELIASNQPKVSDSFLQEMDELVDTKSELLGGGSMMMDDSRNVGYGGSDYIENIVDAVLAPDYEAFEERQDAQKLAERKAWGVQDKRDKDIYRSFDRLRQRYVRASDIQSPAPNGHFLREFGQSDRELIENANDQASITQALALLNGSVSNVLMAQYSLMTRNLRADKSPNEKLDTVYLSMMSRFPTAEERQLLLPIVQEDGVAGAYRVMWTLFNTRQFLFIQ